MNCEAISGWASGYADATVTVDLFRFISPSSETYVTSAVANQYRSDGHGYHGFRIPLPDSLKDGQAKTFRIRTSGLLLSTLDGTCYSSGGYQYYLPNNLDATKWTQNGSMTLGGAGFTIASGGSWISNVPVPDGSSDYEVRMALNLAASGGTYAAYLRASSDAMGGAAAQGT